MKKPLIYLLSAGLVLSLTSGIDTTYAVGTDSSDASIQFTAPTGSVDPVDPRDPDEAYPGDPEDEDEGNNTDQAGPLSLDYISNIDFGEKEITTSEFTYESTTASPFIQISDRRGSGDGWLVTAEATSFNGTIIENEDTEEENTISLGETLPGSTISFLNGVAEAPDDTTTAEPEVNQIIELSTNGGQVNVANALANEDGEPTANAEGLGLWVISWLTDDPAAELNENVTLTVPEAAASEGTHTASINWTLTDGPTESPINTPSDDTSEGSEL